MRRLILFVLLLAALIGTVTAAAGITQERDKMLRGYVDATQSQDLPYRLPRMGVNAELMQLQYAPDALDAQLDRMQQANITWVRQFFLWDAYEPARGEIDPDIQRQWDAIADAFRQRDDLALVAVLMTTPPWARPESAMDDATVAPASPEDFAAFARAFALRYGDVIDHYQIWDEPNLFTAWGGLDPRPADYVALLQAAHTAVHSADADATVIAAALAPTTETSGKNISDLLYLRDLYALGAAPYMDAVAAKPYGFDRAPSDRTVSGDILNFSRIVALREIMVEAGDAKKALWASAWGWNSLPDDWRGAPSIWGSIDADTQARYTLEALTRAEREWPWLGGMILQHWQPDAAPDDPVWGFALVAPDDTPTPLLDALTNRPMVNAATDGLYHPRTRYAAYSGVWTFSDLGADIGWQRDSRFSFTFQGTDVALLLRKDDYVGYLYPRVNDQPANALPRDSAGNSYLILTSGSLEPELALIPVARALAPAQHQLTAVADRGFDRWALAGFAVSSGDLREPYTRQITLAWLTAGAAFVALLTTAIGIDWPRTFAPLVSLLRRLNALWQFILSAAASVLLMFGMLLTFGDAVPQIFRREPVHLIASLVTAGLIYLNVSLIVTIGAALLLFVLFVSRPINGLLLVVLYAPLFLFPVELYRFAFPMAELLLILTLAAWIMWQLIAWAKRHKGIAAPRVTVRWHALDGIVLTFVMLGIIALVGSARRDVALTELRTLIIEPALFYLMLRTLPLSRIDWNRLIAALVASGLIVAFVGLYLYVQGEAIITAEGEARRMASVYGSPNNVALLLGRAIPFLIGAALLVKRLRLWALLALVPMGAAFALTQSVGGLFLGLPAAVAAMLLVIYRRRAVPWLIALVIGAVLVFALLASSSDRFARALDFTQGTNFFRLRLWESTLDVLADHPLTGLGLDQFLYTFRGTYIRPDAWQEPNLSHPHNVVLDFWVRLGIGGVILLFGAVTVLVRWLRRIDAPRSAMFAGLVGALIYTGAHGLIDNSVFVNDLALINMLFLALVVHLSRYKDVATVGQS